MQNIKSDFFYKYLEPFTLINGVKLTRRQIEVLACILSGKSAKTIASFLSISSKTVESHFHSIMQQVGCNSRDGIINFIESSNQFSHLQKYYSYLIIENYFKRNLQDVAKLIKTDHPFCLIVACNQQESVLLAKQLTDYFKQAGFKIGLAIREETTPVDSLFDMKKSQDQTTLYLISEEFIKNTELSPFLHRISQSTEHNIFVFPKIQTRKNSELYKLLQKTKYVDFSEQENEYLAIFEILKQVMPTVNLENIIAEFKVKYEAFRINMPDESINNNSEQHEQTLPLEIKNSGNIQKKIILKKFLSFFVSFCVLGITVYFFLGMKEKKIIFQGQTKTIRSDIVFPKESAFLNRPELITSLDSLFQESKEIKTVAIVGQGGSGKTTLARQYAHQQKIPVIWEINAETKKTLRNSFDDLAEALTQAEDDQSKLNRIREIKNEEEKDKQIIQFIKEHLKDYSNWLLIFDNVEKLTDIHPYFPEDTTTWGKGKILLTTRDSNIQNNTSIIHILSMEELTPAQKLTLFTNIFGNDLLTTQIEETKNFLYHIPSFPLDIIIAAYYLKVTNNSYEEYLRHILQHNQDFESIQENLLKEASNYAKTRYGIISSSLQNLLNTNKDFGELLLLISLLDSQNIPIELLKKYKSDLTVDNFIYYLQKYSLISSHISFLSGQPMFSIHRSTQTTIFAYLMKALRLKENHQYLQFIADLIENYINDNIDNANIPKLRLLVNHAETFLIHTSCFKDELKAGIESVLGRLYYHLYYSKQSKSLLKKNLKTLTHSPNKNPARILSTLTYLGLICHRLCEYNESKNFYKQALAVCQKYFPEDHLKASKTLMLLGSSYKTLAQYDKAKYFLEQGFNIHQKHFPKDHIGFAWSLSRLGGLYIWTGEYEIAEQFLNQSLALYKQHCPEKHLTIFHTTRLLAHAYRHLGKYEKAKNLLEQSITLCFEHFGEVSDLDWCYVHLGNVYMKLGQYKEAKLFMEKGVDIHNKYLLSNDLDAGWMLTHLGNIYKKLGYYQKAEQLFEQALNIYNNYSVSENHVERSWTEVHLASLYINLGYYSKAKVLLEKSLAIFKKNFSESHGDIAWVESLLGNVYCHLGEYQKAKVVLSHSITTYERIFKNHNPKIARIFAYLGRVYQELGEIQKAKNLLEKSIAIYEKQYGAEHIETAQALTNLGRVYMAEGNLDYAEKVIKKAYKILKNSNHPEQYYCLESLYHVYLKKFAIEEKIGNENLANYLNKQAIAHLSQAQESVKKDFAQDSPHLIRLKSWSAPIKMD